MDRRPRRLIRRGASLALALAFAATLAAAANGPTFRREGELAGQPVEIELVGLEAPAADAALGAAWIELARSESVLASHLDAFERAGGGPMAPEPPVWDLLTRAEGFCQWSSGTVSVLGGRVLDLWRAGGPSRSRPTPDELAAAAASARCDRISADPSRRTVRLAAGTRVDFEPFERGWAVDRAVEALRAADAPSGRVRLGPVVRAYGPGPTGRGWRYEFPELPSLTAPLEGFWLRDRAIVLLRADERPMVVAGDRLARWIDLRTGSPGGGLVAVAAVTGLGADAEALAWAMFALGPRIGIAKASELEPEPSVLWLVGSGESPPLLLENAWSALPGR